MSKQYLSIHTLDDDQLSESSDAFGLAISESQLFSISGSGDIKIFDTTDPTYPLTQTIVGAHSLGCHHIAISHNQVRAATAGFGGECKTWKLNGSSWQQESLLSAGTSVGEVWAIALTDDGQYLAATTFDGRVNVWDNNAEGMKIRDFETKGSFGLSIAISPDGKYTATGHQSGEIYVLNNETGKIVHALTGLLQPIRTVAFSPLGTLLAAAGDACFVALYDTASGEQVANLVGHKSWIFSLDWNFSGEYLLTGSFDGKVKVWSVERRECVATHSIGGKTVWQVKWMPKVSRNECFAVASSGGNISIYREATGA